MSDELSKGPTVKATQEQFESLYVALGGQPGRAADAVFHPLRIAYSSGRRRYHTLEHIGWVLHRLGEMEEVERHRGAKFDEATWNELKWAVWFHDFVLEGSPKDEEQSAEVAVLHLPRADAACQGRVANLILATSHDRVPQQEEHAILCDADLSILGASSEVFDHYEALVREEWAHVPDELFAGGRLAILKRIDRHPRIYWTRYGRDHWEDRARANLTRSMTRLQLLTGAPCRAT